MPFPQDAILIWIYYLGLFVSQAVVVSFRVFTWPSHDDSSYLTGKELIWKFYQIISMFFQLYIWGSKK